ncbi:MAG: serine/threonine-protein phosphatase [Desulfovibrio sp.]|nr:serine/threonine-protein phosphatase [Desulfovibrio sp.]
MRVDFYTNQGPSRSANQDGLFLGGESFVDTSAPLALTFANDAGMFAVIDGMGGPAGGEMATRVILGGLQNVAGKSGDCLFLEREFLNIQKIIHAEAFFFPRMGAAIAGIWINPEASLVFNCGDCRVYRSRSGFLERLTHDHSVVQELVDAGRITEDEARYHPRKNLMTSALAADDPDPQIYCREIGVAAGDQFLLCSDGLWECLSLEEMEECMANPPEIAANALKEAVWENTARDNVSFAILTFG